MKEFKGINNVDSAEDIEDDELRAAKNVDINAKFGLRRRSGFTKKYSGNNCHSVALRMKI